MTDRHVRHMVVGGFAAAAMIVVAAAPASADTEDYEAEITSGTINLYNSSNVLQETITLPGELSGDCPDGTFSLQVDDGGSTPDSGTVSVTDIDSRGVTVVDGDEFVVDLSLAAEVSPSSYSRTSATSYSTSGGELIIKADIYEHAGDCVPGTEVCAGEDEGIVAPFAPSLTSLGAAFGGTVTGSDILNLQSGDSSVVSGDTGLGSVSAVNCEAPWAFLGSGRAEVVNLTLGNFTQP